MVCDGLVARYKIFAHTEKTTGLFVSSGDSWY